MRRMLLLIPLALAACASPCKDRYTSRTPAELNKLRIEFLACIAADELTLEAAVKRGDSAKAAEIRQERAQNLQGLAQLEVQIANLPATYEGCAKKCCLPTNPKKCGCSAMCPCWKEHGAQPQAQK